MKTSVYINNESGMALVIALVLLLALTVLGVSSLVTSTLDIQLSGNERRAAESLNLADAGIETGLLDALNDYKLDAGGWSNATFRAIYNGTNHNIDLGTTQYGEFSGVAVPSETQWGNPFSSDGNITGAIGNAVDPYGGAFTLGDGKYRVLLLRDADEPNEIYIRSYAEHSTGARKILQLRLVMDTLDAWRNAVFAGSGSATATINGNVNVSGSMHILGTGDTNSWSISGNATVLNGYKNAGTPSVPAADMWSRVGHTLEVVEGLTYNGQPVYTLESVFRSKNVQVTIGGSAAIGDAATIDSNGDGINDIIEYDGHYYKPSMDAVYANKAITGTVYADETAWPDGYDLGDKIQLPTLQEDYAGQLNRNGQPLNASDCVDPNACVYKDYITTMSVVVNGASAFSTSCSLTPGVTDSFCVGYDDNAACEAGTGGTCVDPNGCLKWVKNPAAAGDPNLVIDGRVQITGCSQLILAPGGSSVIYQGKGIIYTGGDVRIDGNLINPVDREFLTHDLLGLITEKSLNMAESTPQSVLMGGFYAAQTIGTSKVGKIFGAMVANLFCMGPGVDLAAGDGRCTNGNGNTSDIFYTSGISEELTNLGMLKGKTVYYFDYYDWEQIH